MFTSWCVFIVELGSVELCFISNSMTRTSELTLADSHNSQTCRFRFTMPFSGIRCALGMLIGLKERGSGMLIAVQRTAQTNKKQKSYPKIPMSVFSSLSRYHTVLLLCERWNLTNRFKIQSALTFLVFGVRRYPWNGVTGSSRGLHFWGLEFQPSILIFGVDNPKFSS